MKSPPYNLHYTFIYYKMYIISGICQLSPHRWPQEVPVPVVCSKLRLNSGKVAAKVMILLPTAPGMQGSLRKFHGIYGDFIGIYWDLWGFHWDLWGFIGI